MTDQNNTAPAVWDPTARGGAGGWVRGGGQGGPPPPGPGGGAQPPPAQGEPPAAPQRPGPAGDQGPPPGRPYQGAAPGHDEPTRLVPPVPSDAPGGYGFPPPPGPDRPPYQQASPPAPPTPPYQQAPYQQQPGPGQGFPSHATAGPPAGAPYEPYPPGQYPAGQFEQGQFEQGQYDQGRFPQGQYAGYQEIDLQDEERRPRNRTPLLVAVGLLLVLGVGAGAVWAVQNSSSGPENKAGSASATGQAGDTGGQPAPLPTGQASAPASAPASAAASPSATPSADGVKAQTQARALDELLTRAEGAKAPIGSAVAKVSSCPAKADIESAAQVFDTGAQQREQFLAELVKLDFADVAGGAEAVQSLRTAWQQSAEIDRAYAAWARAVSAQGCPSGNAPTTAEKKRADELNPQATLAKKDFVTKWKPAVDTYGLTPRTWDRI
ncbi:hypothetical protein [Kitasatospora sp. NPDC057015]|uniref:hypothetical protein n=1 Tax=Kitasatospora sp. NPDC057015 TaxID=3346001 RepID=UPI0036359D8B